MYTRSLEGYYSLPNDKKLLRNPRIYLESFEELSLSHGDEKKINSNEPDASESKKLKTITLDYTEADIKADQLPFDPFCAFEIRLQNFANGAIDAINHLPEQKLTAARITKIEELVKTKLNQLALIQQHYQDKEPPLKVLSIELNRFYTEDLPAAAGLTLQEIGLGEALYTWQAIPRPKRVTRHCETISASKDHKQNLSSAEEHLVIEQIEEPFLPPLTPSQKRELIKVHSSPPEWFTDLPAWTQHLLKSRIIPKTEEGDWSHYEKSHPTVLRRIPGTHTTRHRLVIKDHLGNILLETLAIRQGALTSFGMKNPQERQHSATENLRQVLRDQCKDERLDKEFEKVWGIKPAALDIPPAALITAEETETKPKETLLVRLPILLCSLLTPGNQSNFVGKCIDALGLSETDSGDPGGTLLIQEKEQACKQCDSEKKCITSFNFAVNSQRKVKKTLDQDFIATAKKFRAKLESHVKILESNSDKILRGNRLKLLAFAITQLEYINSDAFEQDKNRPHHINKNIYRAALHDIIVRLIVGLPIVSCKSSKDRTGCEFIIADAILIDWSIQLALQQELCFSAYTPEKRPAFIGLVARLYASGHQLFNAHDNSPGAPGIKDEGVLSQDIRNCLGVAYKTSKKLADSNKPQSFWQKHRKKIWCVSMVIIAFLLGMISLILFCTGKLSPLGILAAKAADTALSAVGYSLVSAVLTAACCRMKEIYTRYKSSAYTFVAELARISKKLGPVGSSLQLSPSTNARLKSIGGTASYSNKTPHAIDPPPFGVSPLAWRQKQRQYEPQHTKENAAVNHLRL